MITEGKMKNFIVEEREELFTYLKKKITNKSKNNIKSLLKNGYVWVMKNGCDLASCRWF